MVVRKRECVVSRSGFFESKRELYDVLYSDDGYAVLFKEDFTVQPNERPGSEKFIALRRELENLLRGRINEDKPDEVLVEAVGVASPVKG